MGPIYIQRSIHVLDCTGQESFSKLFHIYTGIIFNILERLMLKVKLQYFGHLM